MFGWKSCMNAANLTCSKFTFTSDTDSIATTVAPATRDEQGSRAKVNYEGQVFGKLNSLDQYDLSKRDIFGRTFLHWVCITGRDDILNQLLKKHFGQKSKNRSSWPENKSPLNLCIADWENGYNCLHYAIYHGNFSCVKVLLQSELVDIKSREDLLNAKDREGATPIDLLYYMTDIRSFKQIPVSIGLSSDHYTTSVVGFNTVPRFGEVGTDAEKNKPKINANNDWWNELRGASEMYVLGSNKNSTLGCGDSDDRNVPVKLNSASFFINHSKSLRLSERLLKPRIKDIKISKYHTVVVTTDQVNNIFVCGSNKTGRLGLETNLLVPKFSFEPIEFFNNIHIQKVAVAEDHTVALDSNGRVYAWGSNQYGQLGHSADDMDVFSNVPVQLNTLELRSRKILGVCCSKIHSVAYTESSVLIWGLNIGQFGFQSLGEQTRYKASKTAIIQSSPKKFEFNYGSIIQVLALEFATLILTNTANEIHVYMNSFHAKIQPPLIVSQFANHDKDNFDLFVFKATSSKIDVKKICGKGNVIALLYDNGYVLSFKLEDNAANSVSLLNSINFCVVWSPRRKNMLATDVDVANDGSIVLTTTQGLAFRKDANSGSRKSRDSKAKKIPSIDRVVKVSCDPSFGSFAFLRDNVDSIPLKLVHNNICRDIQNLSPMHQILDSPKANGAEDDFVQHFLQRQKIVKHDDFDGVEMIVDNQQEDVTAEYNLHLEKNKNDMLFRSYLDRWCLRNHLDPKRKNKVTLGYKAADFLEAQNRIKKNGVVGKTHKWKLVVEGESIVIDAEILAVRSSVLFGLFTKSQTVQHDSISITSHTQSRKLVFNNVNILSVLMILHFLYTDEEVYIWDEYPVGSMAPAYIQATKRYTLSLGRLVKIVNALDKFKCSSLLVESLLCLENPKYEPLLDTQIILQDGTCFASSTLLLERSSFFKNCLSSRWRSADRGKITLKFEDILKQNFTSVLRYLYGESAYQMFDRNDELADRHAVINVALEMIDICDELLLLDLKDYCQYYISEFIDSSNVSVLINLALQFNAKKMFEQCCWYIFNNVIDVVVNNADVSSKYLTQSICYKIDRYFKYFYQLRKLDKLKTNVKSFKPKKASEILYNFLMNLNQLNQVYMSADNKFEPLIDIPRYKAFDKASKILSKDEKQRKSSIGSPSNSFSDHSAIFAAASPARTSFSANNLAALTAFRGKGFVSFDESAIEDGDDNDDFIPVSTYRRKSSKNTSFSTDYNDSASKAKGPMVRSNSNLATESTVLLYAKPSVSPRPVSQSSISGDGHAWPTLENQNKSPHVTSSSSFKFPSGNVKKEGKKIIVSGGIGRGAGSSKPSVNIFETEKLQKPKPQANPWAKPPETAQAPQSSVSSSKKPIPVTRNGNSSVGTSAAILGRPKTAPFKFNAGKQEEAFPSLALLSKPKEEPSSLAAIMHEEEMKRQREQELAASKKTLAEIQEEEAFNKWFEEESKRVQREMGILDTKPKKKNETNKRKGAAAKSNTTANNGASNKSKSKNSKPKLNGDTSTANKPQIKAHKKGKENAVYAAGNDKDHPKKDVKSPKNLNKKRGSKNGPKPVARQS